jgi:hypothetical protein
MSAKERYKVYRKYLLLKVAEEDWHGVADAAMDIRDLLSANPKLAAGNQAWAKQGGKVK